MKTAEEIFNEAFAPNTRAPRSAQYRQGVLAVLRCKLHGDDFDIPYRAGTPECDAYLAGTDEGHKLLRGDKQ